MIEYAPTPFASALDGGARVYFDANALIALVEHDGVAIREIFERAQTGRIAALTSALTAMEVYVDPFRRGGEMLVAAYRELFTGSTGLSVVAVTDDIIERAARLRAETSTKLADAIHLASAEHSGCKVFLSSDERIRPRAPMLRIGIESIAAGR